MFNKKLLSRAVINLAVPLGIIIIIPFIIAVIISGFSSELMYLPMIFGLGLFFFFLIPGIVSMIIAYFVVKKFWPTRPMMFLLLAVILQTCMFIPIIYFLGSGGGSDDSLALILALLSLGTFFVHPYLGLVVASAIATTPTFIACLISYFKNQKEMNIPVESQNQDQSSQTI